MDYCTADEVRRMIKDDALNTLLGDTYIEDPEEREAKIGPIIQEAIADAQGEIDGYLCKRYPVPLTRAVKVINKFAKDIAVYNLFSRIGIDESNEQKNYLNRYRAAIKFLEAVAAGRVDIGVTDSKRVASTGFVVHTSPRLMSRNTLRGM